MVTSLSKKQITGNDIGEVQWLYRTPIFTTFSALILITLDTILRVTDDYLFIFSIFLILFLIFSIGTYKLTQAVFLAPILYNENDYKANMKTIVLAHLVYTLIFAIHSFFYTLVIIYYTSSFALFNTAPAIMSIIQIISLTILIKTFKKPNKIDKEKIQFTNEKKVSHSPKYIDVNYKTLRNIKRTIYGNLTIFFFLCFFHLVFELFVFFLIFLWGVLLPLISIFAYKTLDFLSAIRGDKKEEKALKLILILKIVNALQFIFLMIFLVIGIIKLSIFNDYEIFYLIIPILIGIIPPMWVFVSFEKLELKLIKEIEMLNQSISRQIQAKMLEDFSLKERSQTGDIVALHSENIKIKELNNNSSFHCTECGEILPSKELYCPRCGTRMEIE